MTVHMQKEIENLKSKLLSLCAAVEKNLCLALQSVKEKDKVLARRVIEDDEQIDQMEVDVEEECLKILALHQPVAIDLRFIITALKINNDLERIGDLAVNIAERGEFLAGWEPISAPFDFDAMAEKTQWMLTESLDSLVDMDCKRAYQVCAADDAVDAINREMYKQVEASIVAHPSWTRGLLHLLSISRHLERVADHATNIAEDVIYMAEGRVVRHKAEDYREQMP
ncbi:MAG: phosphate signaling complex protein PhoU [Sedimentisphaerales bacterium]|nr:phosphate signaling complex protein PhoU [Sedimentisphaerales bacterium]